MSVRKPKIINPATSQTDSDDQTEEKKKINQKKKKKDSKVLKFAFTNPKNNQADSKQITLYDDTPMADIIQKFINDLGVNDIIGMKINGIEYMKNNNITFSDTNLYYDENSHDNCEISFIFDLNSNYNKPKDKYIVFKYMNPISNQTESKQFTINNSITISNIISNFNICFGVKNIIGFRTKSEEYKIENKMRLVETALCSDKNLDNCNITFIFNTNPNKIAVYAEGKNQKRKIKLRYFNSMEEIEYNFSSPSSIDIRESLLKKDSYILLYFPGGSMKNSSINDFFEKSGNFPNHLYGIVIKSSFDYKQANDPIDISQKSIISLFPDIIKNNSNEYVCLLCCILKYIQMNFYKSLHIIKSFFETVSFVPFLTSLYSVYDDKVTKLSIFTIVSFLLFDAPKFDDLKSLFATMSSYICKWNSDIFRKNQSTDHTFKHDARGPPQVQKADCNPYFHPDQPIFIAKTQELRSRNYWSIIKYKERYILGSILPDEKDPSEQSNLVSYYDPTQTDTFNTMTINNLEEDEKRHSIEKNKSNEKRVESFNDKYSQATTAIIDYSGSMIACFDEKSERRSKIAVNIINQFIQAGNDMNVNDPFTLLNKSLKNEIIYPLEHNSEDFVSPSRVYDRIERVVNYMTTEKYTNKLTKDAIKRILLVSDGQDGKSKKTKYDILKLLLDNHIILDVILLKDEGNSAKDLCALSHISGGNYYRPYSEDDAYFIAKYEKLVKIPEEKPFEHLKSYKFISNTEFDNISDNMRIKDKINIIKASVQKDFYENRSLYSVFSKIQNSINANLYFQFKRIQKEINICADYIRSQKNQRKEPFFMIYREFFVNSPQIRQDKVIVFLKGAKSSTNKVIHQASITFTDCYPFEMPKIELLSKAELENPLPNGIFKLKSGSYEPKMRLIKILFKLNEALVCKKKPIEKNDDLDPISSLDQIRSVFRYYEIPDEMEIKSYNKYYQDL